MMMSVRPVGARIIPDLWSAVGLRGIRVCASYSRPTDLLEYIPQYGSVWYICQGLVKRLYVYGTAYATDPWQE